jgi:hypothetical protein
MFNPASKLRIVFQCTRSQAAGLELELCGAIITFSILSMVNPAAKVHIQTHPSPRRQFGLFAMPPQGQLHLLPAA